MKYGSKKQIIDILCKTYKVNYKLIERSDNWGHAECDVFRERIYINTNLNQKKNEFVSSVLHEICHIIAKRTGKFPVFHEDRVDGKENMRAFIRTALRAERYVDAQAKRLMKMYFPGMKYVPGYDKTEDVKWLHEVFLQDFKIRLKRRKRG